MTGVQVDVLHGWRYRCVGHTCHNDGHVWRGKKPSAKGHTIERVTMTVTMTPWTLVGQQELAVT